MTNLDEEFSRTEILIGKENMEILKSKKVAIFGVGGVGGYVAEGLVRSGISHFLIVDNDKVNITNLNRQIIATTKTLDRFKVDVMKERILSINPNANVITKKIFYLKETKDEIDFDGYDYIVDAVDTVTAKILIIEEAKKKGIKVISAMGAGNKMDPTKLVVADISKTSICPLARVMRYELRKRGIKDVKVVYSTEEAIKPQKIEDETTKKQIPGSTAFVPSAMGLVISSVIISDLINNK